MNRTVAAKGPVVIIGAGIAGLVAAREARRQGRTVELLEGSQSPAGMAASHRDDDGFIIDVGAHFVTNRFAAALGMAAECRTVHRYGEVVHVDGRPRRYPMGLLGVPRFVGSALRSRLSGPASVDNAADWFRNAYGRALADEVALPLVEAWSGVPAELLSPAVGDKIPAGLAHTVFLANMARLSRRAVAIGYCQAQPQSAAVYHVYPNGGVARFCEQLALELGEVITLGARVETIAVCDNAVVGVRTDDRTIETDTVIRTAPVNRLADLVQGTDRLDAYRRFRFRPVIFVNLKLRGRGLLDDVVVWNPAADPYFRLTEAPVAMPWLAPEGLTTVSAEIGAELDDPSWSASDAELTERCVEALTRSIADVRSRLIDSVVLRSPIAYPVFLNAYEADRQRLVAGNLGVRGLHSIGRNGSFDHILMEDIYWRTKRLVQTL